MIVGRVDTGGFGARLPLVRRPFARLPLAAAVLALAGGLGGELVGRSQLMLHACLTGGGLLAWLGLRLALVRTSVDCPEGTLVLAGSTARGALVVASIAAPTLLVHLLAAACGVSLSALLTRAASGIRAVLRAVLRVFPDVPRASWERAALVVGRDLARAPTRVRATRYPNRGPPA